MAEAPEFQKKQLAFAAHIRDPKNVSPPDGVEDRRMAIYRELFFNNISNLLGHTFPVIKKIHSKERWQRFIRQFMQKHRAETPYFLQLPEEFVGFLQNEYEPLEDDFQFLLELAHYEYVEVLASVSENENDLGSVAADGDMLEGVPIRSNLVWVYAYQFPVHRISPEFLPEQPGEQPTFLAVYRRDDDKVRFLELNSMTAALLEAIAGNDKDASGRELLRDLALAAQFEDVDAFLAFGEEALTEMRSLGIILGAKAT
jgi:hypothetical protein